MRRDIPIKKEATEAMYGIAGRLAFLGFEATFEIEFDEIGGEYDTCYLIVKSRGALLKLIDSADDTDFAIESRYHDFERMKLPEMVSLHHIYTEIKGDRLFLEIDFDFTDFVNANMENKRS